MHVILPTNVLDESLVKYICLHVVRQQEGRVSFDQSWLSAGVGSYRRGVYVTTYGLLHPLPSANHATHARSDRRKAHCPQEKGLFAKFSTSCSNVHTPHKPAEIRMVERVRSPRRKWRCLQRDLGGQGWGKTRRLTTCSLSKYNYTLQNDVCRTLVEKAWKIRLAK